MLTELPGLVLSRTIPAHCLSGIVTGAYQVCGGVIRNASGQIVAHLINGGASIAGATPLAGVSAAAEVINMAQLYRIGKSVSSIEAATAQLVTLAQGTAVLSGLTLAASIGGFAFLSGRLGRLDRKLGELAKDVRAIHAFLGSQERASLNSALQTLALLPAGQDEKVRIPLLVNARQTVGSIHQRYREQLETAGTVEEMLAVEEYFSVTALSHALCTAELGMQAAAASELEKTYQLWLSHVRRIGREAILASPERFLTPAYGSVKTSELVDWLDFVHATAHGIDWIDRLRDQSAGFRLPRFGSGATDRLGIELIRKFCARDRILQGYVSQYAYFAEHGLLPGQQQEFVARLGTDGATGGCHIFLPADERHGDPHRPPTTDSMARPDPLAVSSRPGSTVPEPVKNPV